MKALTRNDLLLALDKCAALTGDREFVVVGSVSILGSTPSAPEDLTISADIDLFPREKESGEKNEMIDRNFGQGSRFELDNNFYIEGVGSWTMMTAPSGWEERMAAIISPGGVIGWCLDPLDLAYNKLEAGRPKDLHYVAGMLQAGILSEPSLREFLRERAPSPAALAHVKQNLRQVPPAES